MCLTTLKNDHWSNQFPLLFFAADYRFTSFFAILAAEKSVYKPDPQNTQYRWLPQKWPEPVFLNVYGAQESIPRNEFRQPIWPGGPRYDNPISTSILAPIDFLKNSSSEKQRKKSNKIIKSGRNLKFQVFFIITLWWSLKLNDLSYAF